MMTCLPLSLPLYKDRTGIGIFKQWMAFICWNPTLKTVRNIQTSQRNLSWHRRNKCPLSVKKNSFFCHHKDVINYEFLVEEHLH